MDQFGLPRFWTMLDTPERTASRLALLEKNVTALFATVVLHLGDADGRALWDTVADRAAVASAGTTVLSNRQTHDSEWDEMLLKAYDDEEKAGTPHDKIATKIAEMFKDVGRPGLGGKKKPTTSDSIARHVLRLVHARLVKVAAKSMRPAIAVPSLLGMARRPRQDSDK